MRGLETGKTRIRHAVFTEIARMAYEGGDHRQTLEELPARIVPGDGQGGDVFLERAVVGERLRAAMGLSVRSVSQYARLTEGVEESAIAERYYEPPLIDVIPFACNRCPDGRYVVTDLCQDCFEHPCTEICPRQAVARGGGRASIDPARCVRCGRCVEVCAFRAIVRQDRPCRAACGVDCIGSDAQGTATIDQSRCVSCGQCLVRCPFGAIVDKSQIFQTILALKSEVPVYVALAPSFVGQFGPAATAERMRAAFRRLGFADVYEVAIGADLCVVEEAEEFLLDVPGKHPFLVTSCCPSWCDMIKRMFPQLRESISVSLTPMVQTARMIKQCRAGCKVAFVGPCDAKKLEATRRSVRSDVDFVLTFEEVLGMFEARGIDFADVPPEEESPLTAASGDARRFAVAGGVADAVVHAIHAFDPDREVKVARAEGLAECKKLLRLAKAGRYDGYLLEGMACEGGCVAGAGTLQSIDRSRRLVEEAGAASSFSCALESSYKYFLPLP